jgi:hypothetical protein
MKESTAALSRLNVTILRGSEQSINTGYPTWVTMTRAVSPGGRCVPYFVRLGVRRAIDFGSTVNDGVKMAYHCPACSRAILSRRNKLCGFCGEPLPAELLFTPAQIETIEAASRGSDLFANRSDPLEKPAAGVA